MKSGDSKRIVGKFIITNIIIIILVIILAIIGILKSNSNMKKIENNNYANIIGKLINEYNLTESEVEDIVFNNNTSVNVELGKNFLEEYGYSDNLLNKYNKLNLNNNNEIIMIVCFIILFFIGQFLINLYLIFHMLKKEANKIITVANNFVIYGKVEYINTSHSLFISKYEDKINEICQRIELMVEEMKSERENTKELINTMTHQLKTPISSLKIFYELMKNENLELEKRNDFIRRSENEIERINYIITNIINISRLETEVIQINRKKYNIGNTLVKAMEYVYGKALEKNIDISINNIIDKEVYHDFNWTREALINIIDNAIKYSKQNSEIVISTFIDEVSYMIAVKDKGIGISKDDFTKIFKKFYRGKREENLKEEGVGLGLYISKLIIEKQNGSMEILSKQDIGTIVNIRFYNEYNASN